MQRQLDQNCQREAATDHQAACIASPLHGVGTQTVEKRCRAVEALDQGAAQRVEQGPGQECRQRWREGYDGPEQGCLDETRQLNQCHEDEAVDRPFDRALAPMTNAGVDSGTATMDRIQHQAGEQEGLGPKSQHGRGADQRQKRDEQNPGQVRHQRTAPEARDLRREARQYRAQEEQRAKAPAARPVAIDQPAAADDGELVEQEQEDDTAEGGLAIPAEPPPDAHVAADVGEEMSGREQEQAGEQEGQQEQGRGLAPAQCATAGKRAEQVAAKQQRQGQSAADGRERQGLHPGRRRLPDAHRGLDRPSQKPGHRGHKQRVAKCRRCGAQRLRQRIGRSTREHGHSQRVERRAAIGSKQHRSGAESQSQQEERCAAPRYSGARVADRRRSRRRRHRFRLAIGLAPAGLWVPDRAP